MGGLFNIFVWYYAKDLHLFDDNAEKAAEENDVKDDGNALYLKIRKEKQ